MNKIITENTNHFKEIERKIYEMGCSIACEMMSCILEEIDQKIAQQRDKKKYRDKGKRKTVLKTLMGEVAFSRHVYETKMESGKKAHLYLLDQHLEFETFGKISPNLAEQIAMTASEESYRKTADRISQTTGQRISHGGVWNVIQGLGEKIEEQENEAAQRAARHEGRGKREVKVLFEEADGVWIAMRKTDRPKTGKRRELKVGVAYSGWKQTGKDRYELQDKTAVCGFDDSRGFAKRMEGALGEQFRMDEVEQRLLNGDGGGWIKTVAGTADVAYQLDRFHLNREIVRSIAEKDKQGTLLKLLEEGRVKDSLVYVKALGELEENEKQREKLENLYRYMEGNSAGLVPWQKRGLCLPKPPQGMVYRAMGTMEHHICDLVAQRMKNCKAVWSLRGAGNLARIRALKVTGRLCEQICEITKIVLPERYAEETEQVLTAASSAKKTGKGYAYPVTGGMPYVNAGMNNGRKAIQNMVNDRMASDLVLRF